jgi:hypothetical protein
VRKLLSWVALTVLALIAACASSPSSQSSGSGSSAGSGQGSGASGNSSGTSESSGTAAGGSGSSTGSVSDAGSTGASSGGGDATTSAEADAAGDEGPRVPPGDSGAFVDGPSSTASDGGCGTGTVVAYPSLPGAAKSTLYTVSANGTALFVEQMTKFSPEMQVHYAHLSVAGGAPASFSVTVSQAFSAFTLSPKSRNIAATRNGNTITFCSGPNYLILAFDTMDLLFILIDDAEASPPQLGDANVKNIGDYNVDDTGATLVTSTVQTAIDAASGATENILYFPPGKYLVGELWLRSNMTLYLAGGAVLYGSNNVGDFNTPNPGDGGVNIEGTVEGMIRLYDIQNTKILGRGVIDSNGKSIRAQGLQANLVKIEGSSNILIDGIVTRDSSYWNTLVYESDMVTIQNYKVINVRPTSSPSTTYNQTDGVDFDESTNGHLNNAFLYTGDDNMATKNEYTTGHNINNILHENIVGYSNSVCAKIGTKTLGQTIDSVVFRNIDVVKADRALAIDAYDTAVVENTTFENVRIEAADSNLIDLDEDMPPTFRTAANMSVTNNTTFTNVAADVKQPIILHGKSATVDITGVHFSGLSVEGHAITSDTDPNASWDINAYVSNITVAP